MSFLQQLKQIAALACGTVQDMCEEVGAEAVVSMVISHPGTTEDALVIGGHELADLLAIILRLETGDAEVSTVTATDGARPTTVRRGSMTQ